MARLSGTIIKFDDERGFGFIAPDSETGDLFFHVNAIVGGREGITIGEPVYFRIGLDRKGRFEAKRIWRTASTGLRPPALVALTVSGSFLAALIALTMRWQLLGVPAVYGVMSVISFVAYAMDKRAARTSAWRTAESTLHLWDLAGGWPGGLVAQQLLRHKRQKIGFVTVTALTACFHILAWGWLVLSEDGRAVLSNLG